MSEGLEYNEEALKLAAEACRHFLEEVGDIPPAAVALLFPALRARLEEDLAASSMLERESQLGRALTPEECEQEGAFIATELMRAEAEAESRMPDLISMLQPETARPPEPATGRYTPEKKEELFNEIVSDKESLSKAIRASQGFWSEMVGGGVDVDARMLIICHLDGMCGHQLARREVERTKKRLGRLLTDEDVDEAFSAAANRHRAINSLSRTKRGELEQLVSELGAHLGEKPGPVAPAQQEARYIA
jgi:hypothetical protein